MDLREKNKRNVLIETNNCTSIDHTRTYEAARATAAAVGTLDVGVKLEPFFEYTDEEKALLVHSKELVDAVGPLPVFLIQIIALERLKIARSEAAQKAKPEKERVELKREELSILGTMRMDNPQPFSFTRKRPIAIPHVFLMSLAHKVHLHLHWWSDNILRGAASNPNSVPTTSINGSEDVIIDVGKMANLHGDEDASTALTWNQCSKNLLAALEKLSVAQDPENPQNTHASEYALHVQFFSKNKWFEDLFHVWYPLERELRLEVLDNTVFDERIWTRELLTTVTIYETFQTYAQGRHTASLARSTTAGCKRRAEGDGNPASAKQQRMGRGGLPVCLICTGPHAARDHPVASSSFTDGTVLFSKSHGRDIRTAAPFRGPQPQVLCVQYNLHHTCNTEHGAGRLHVCSLCGGPHAALSRHVSCTRVRDGNFLP
jgi:hypothetical protein